MLGWILFLVCCVFVDRMTVRKMGYFGGRCALCHDLSVQELLRRGKRLWLLGVIPTPARWKVRESVCESCGACRLIEKSHEIAPVEHFEGDIVTLTAQTNPQESGLDAETLGYGPEDVAAGALTDKARSAEVAAVLRTMVHEYQRAYHDRMPSKRRRIVGFVASIAFFLSIVVDAFIRVRLQTKYGVDLVNAPESVLMFANIVAIVSLAGWCLFLVCGGWFAMMWTGCRTRAKKQQYKRLVDALVPLYPHLDELESALSVMKKKKLALGKLVKPGKLMQRIERVRAERGMDVVSHGAAGRLAA